jgi:hypothetical protein
VRKDQILRDLSIPYLLWRRPFLRASHVAQIDAIEQHRELGGIELRAERAVLHLRYAEAALFEALVREHKSATFPGQHLQPVTAS